MNWKLLTGIGLSCLFCNHVANVTDCLTQKALCQDSNEECFLDWHILPDLSAVFNAGCRSKQVCNLISTTFGKRTIGCSQCCNSPPNSEGIPCNGHLCKQAPVAAGNTCGICDRVGDPHDCAVDQTCQPSEVGKVKILKQDIRVFLTLCYMYVVFGDETGTMKFDSPTDVQWSVR
ncbi:Hypothetical predicted protein [Mytilus galloprovincialis]|uniref:Laminin EGF-like domain-containing protein n=1 Tax=Mytilus galloprovincialis TaxID=29158 RepID=A0A8B6E1I7_MYTGA|nr:Hypothetical predicted protein [Mytilus galloprovincialis]